MLTIVPEQQIEKSDNDMSALEISGNEDRDLSHFNTSTIEHCNSHVN